MPGISRIFFTDSNTKNPLFVYLPAAILKRYRKWWMPGNIHPPNTAELNGACESSDDDEMTIANIELSGGSHFDIYIALMAHWSSG